MKFRQVPVGWFPHGGVVVAEIDDARVAWRLSDDLREQMIGID
jgi:hypothetical protein